MWHPIWDGPAISPPHTCVGWPCRRAGYAESLSSESEAAAATARRPSDRKRTSVSSSGGSDRRGGIREEGVIHTHKYIPTHTHTLPLTSDPPLPTHYTHHKTAAHKRYSTTRHNTCLVPPPDPLPHAVRKVALLIPLLRQQAPLLRRLLLARLREEPGDCSDA